MKGSTTPMPVGFDFDPPSFKLIYFENSFGDACINAQYCATSWSCVAKIEAGSAGGWAVLVDANCKEAQEFRADDEDDDFEEETDEEYRERVAREEEDRIRDEIEEEMGSYEDGLSRSNEDGWYYSDD